MRVLATVIFLALSVSATVHAEEVVPQSAKMRYVLSYSRVPYDHRLLATLKDVQTDVNSRVVYVADWEQYNVPDKWVIDPVSGKGDCEDIALTKRAELVARGVPAAAMKLDQYYEPGKKGRGWHAVLVVSTTLGDFVLDSRDVPPFRRD